MLDERARGSDCTCLTHLLEFGIPICLSYCVFELGVLPVREIEELLVLELDVVGLGSNGRLLLVLPPAVPIDEEKIKEADAL